MLPVNVNSFLQPRPTVSQRDLTTMIASRVTLSTSLIPKRDVVQERSLNVWDMLLTPTNAQHVSLKTILSQRLNSAAPEATMIV